ncbi:MAG: hypothetical protein RSD57_10585 [Comamonas sp.]
MGAKHIVQMHEAQSEALVADVLAQAQQALGDFIVFDVAASLVSLAGLIDLQRLASPPGSARRLLLLKSGEMYVVYSRRRDGVTIFRESLRNDFGPELLLNVHLARRLLSSSSSLFRAMSGASIPPNLARHL